MPNDSPSRPAPAAPFVVEAATSRTRGIAGADGASDSTSTEPARLCSPAVIGPRPTGSSASLSSARAKLRPFLDTRDSCRTALRFPLPGGPSGWLRAQRRGGIEGRPGLVDPETRWKSYSSGTRCWSSTGTLAAGSCGLRRLSASERLSDTSPQPQRRLALFTGNAAGMAPGPAGDTATRFHPRVRASSRGSCSFARAPIVDPGSGRG